MLAVRLYRVALILAFAGCSPVKPPIAELPPPAVSVAKPIKKDVQDVKQFLATLDAAESIDVRARVTGYLREVKFTSGQMVKKDETELFVIDRRPFEAALKKSEGEVKIAEANLKLARSELERINVALKASAGSVSAADKDKAIAQVEVSQAQLDANRAARDQDEINLNFTVIKAEVDGQIGRNLITPGNLVTADQTLLTKIVKPDPIYAYFDVDEFTVQQYNQNNRPTHEPGNEIDIQLGLQQNGDSFPYHGKVNFRNPNLNPSTGTLQVRGTFWQKDQFTGADKSTALPDLEPGYTARVQVAVSPKAPRILVPDRAIGTDQGQKFVYIVNADNLVEYRKVSLGNLYRDRVDKFNVGLRAIEAGLNGDEWVIVNGLQRVRPGIKVAPEEVDPISERPVKETSSKKKS